MGQAYNGVEASPLERLSVNELCGASEARTRTLGDAELRAVWEAAKSDPKSDLKQQMGYPYGPVLRLLILTGQREREVSDMSWSEVDLDKQLWTIPATRMKGGAAHEVPLAPVALDLLRSLPRWTGGDYVFTTTRGAKSINGPRYASIGCPVSPGGKFMTCAGL